MKFLTDNSAAIIAVVALLALIQPWIIIIINRFYKQGKIKVVQAGRLEIGLTNFGPNLGLGGSLWAINKDQFIECMNVKIIRYDKAERNMEWGFFRPLKPFSSTWAQDVEFPSGFIVKSNQSERFDIQFHQFDIRYKIEEYFVTLKNEMFKGLKEILGREIDISEITEVVENPEFKVKADQFYKNFKESDVYNDIKDKISKQNFWQPGEYTFELVVKTDMPQKDYAFKWKFIINEIQSKSLDINVDTILHFGCTNTLPVQYNWVNLSIEVI